MRPWGLRILRRRPETFNLRSRVDPLAPEDREMLTMYPRPETRGECEGGERPCPFVSCRYHLAIDVTHSGSVRVLPDWDDGRDTCALDVADSKEMTLDKIGELLGVTRERIRQMEVKAVLRAERIARVMGLEDMFSGKGVKTNRNSDED